MRYCSKENCKWVGNNEDKYCFDCGTEMLPFFKCQFCEYEYNPLNCEGKFCTGCGKQFNS